MSQNGRTTISVSCEGDDSLRTLLQLLAIKNSTSIAKLVRTAIDTTFESRIAEIKKENPSFFGSSGRQNSQPTKLATKKAQP